MMGPTHRCLGALAGVTVTAATGAPLSTVLIGGLVATATSNGPASPDGDQTDAWNRIDNFLPKKLAGHRGILHWWGLPAAAWVGVHMLEPRVQWAATMAIVGWLSHLLGDFVFGQGRRGGVPILPGGPYLGLHLDTGGLLENGGRFFGIRVPSLTRGLLCAGIIFVILLSILTTGAIV